MKLLFGFTGNVDDVDDGVDTLGYRLTQEWNNNVGNGILVFDDDGTFTFDPNGDFNDLVVGMPRSVQFDFQATDYFGATSNSATVTITVTGENDIPYTNTLFALDCPRNEIWRTIIFPENFFPGFRVCPIFFAWSANVV